MTYFSIGDNSISTETVIAFVVILIVLAVVVWVAYFVLRVKDNNKPLNRRKGRILEKPSQQRSVEWCVVEFENGERVKLRNFHVDTVIIAVGDVGIIDYRGITIQAFHPISENRM